MLKIFTKNPKIILKKSAKQLLIKEGICTTKKEIKNLKRELKKSIKEKNFYDKVLINGMESNNKPFITINSENKTGSKLYNFFDINSSTKLNKNDFIKLFIYYLKSSFVP